MPVACSCLLRPCTDAAPLGAQFIDWGLLPRALLGVLCLLAGNGYIVGINQIYDVDIDSVNKPFLPVAAGAATRPWQCCRRVHCSQMLL